MMVKFDKQPSIDEEHDFVLDSAYVHMLHMSGGKNLTKHENSIKHLCYLQSALLLCLTTLVKESLHIHYFVSLHALRFIV